MRKMYSGFKLVDCISSVDVGAGKATSKRVASCLAFIGKMVEVQDDLSSHRRNRNNKHTA